MTTEPYYEYSIHSKWHGHVESPAAIGAKLLNTLEALSRIDPIFSNWGLADYPNPGSGDEDTDGLNIGRIPLDAARQRIAQIIENYVVRDDAYEPYPDDGYRAIASTSELVGPRVAGLTVRAGGKYEGRTTFGFGLHMWKPPDLTIVTYPLFKAALLAINTVWRAPWACAQAFRYGTISVPGVEILPGLVATRIDSVARVPLDPKFPDSIFHIP